MTENSIRLIICAFFGHEFNERREERRERDGMQFVVHRELTCHRCKLSKVDRSGLMDFLGLNKKVEA